jgi:prophage tail gpP-like protein
MAELDDELTLVVGGQAISGWQDVELTQGMEQIPNHFDIQLTERYSGEMNQAVVKRGDPCEVRLGADKVLTGFIDRYITTGDPSNMQVRIIGRGKTCDLVDCSAEWDGGQISGSNAAEIATKLCAAYGIKVRQVGDVGPAIPQFNFMLGQTPFEIIDSICRFAGLLFYENSDGDLVISGVGSEEAASGLAEGENVERASVTFAHDERFSEYHVYLMATQVLGDVGQGGNQLSVEKDPGVARNRKRFIIAEAPAGGQDVSKRRAIWEATRRAGRGTLIDATVDSWRDSAGKLWAPNTHVPVALPSWRQPAGLKRVLSQVTFQRNAKGSRARLILMPKTAFLPEPIQLLPFFADLA